MGSMILAVLQARVSSSRLPGKVLKPILGTPMLFLQIERVARSRRIDYLVVATSTDPSDDPIFEQCQSRGVQVHRGSLADVLSRFVGAVAPYQPKTVVRLTGDCPLADWRVIDLAIETFEAGGYDYLSNVDPPTYPDGLDVEVFSYRALLDADLNAEKPTEREHVTPFIRNSPERFKVGVLTQKIDQSKLRWTVDDPRDFDLVRTVYEALYPVNPKFETADVLALLRRQPELSRVNSGISRNEGLAKSLAADESCVRRRGS
jgi:spore coat polysaccharide biosynthesis protein SpsF (cytidylyltransferase family)